MVAIRVAAGGAMRTIKADEAETRFAELLREVENGAAIVVTRENVPIALLTPTRSDSERAASNFDQWERFRDQHHVTLGGGVTIRELIEVGRM